MSAPPQQRFLGVYSAEEVAHASFEDCRLPEEVHHVVFLARLLVGTGAATLVMQSPRPYEQSSGEKEDFSCSASSFLRHPEGPGHC